MYYVITLSYKGNSQTDTFKIDEGELINFIQFITDHIDHLESFHVLVVKLPY